MRHEQAVATFECDLGARVVEDQVGTDPLSTSALREVVAAFRRWLHLPDPGVVLMPLATVAANRMPGDPVWLMMIGPPGSGKTEAIAPLIGLDDCHATATLTEAALLSGTPKRDARGAKGGLLREIGEFGIIVAKDFTSVLSMHRDPRAGVLAALREVYDGSWTRHVGTDGGRTLAWSGKVGMVAACTPTIDGHHAVIGSMGERFVFYRLPATDPAAQARRALEHAGREARMRKELSAAVGGFFDRLELPREHDLDAADHERLVRLSTFAVRCRSAVERDGWTRDIELVPEPEAPARLALVLARLHAALTSVGTSREEAWRLVTKAALDSMSAVRRAVLEALAATETPETGVVAEQVAYPTSTTRRALEDLTAHGIVSRHRQGRGKADRWSLTEWARSYWPTVPETSGRPW